MSTADLCAACGKGGDGLRRCTACKLVKYCNIACQKSHRATHKNACRERVAELHDEALFKQPPPNEDCPICFIQLPRTEDTIYQFCCGKFICRGCIFAMMVTSATNGGPPPLLPCPFCRTLEPTSDEEEIKMIKMRMDLSDGGAFHHLACEYDRGDLGLPQNSKKAIELWLRGAELGSSLAHHSLSSVYEKMGDQKKATFHSELAAMGGVVEARYKLGDQEFLARNFDRLMKHFMIVAKAGEKRSMDVIKDQALLRERGLVTKEDYETTLCAYKDTLDGMRSEQRDRVAKHLYAT